MERKHLFSHSFRQAVMRVGSENKSPKNWQLRWKIFFG